MIPSESVKPKAILNTFHHRRSSFDLICFIQAGHHGPSAIQGAPSGAQPCIDGSGADNGSGVQLTNGFRH